MSIYSNVTEEYLIKLRKLAEQQKNQRALTIKNRISKQTHDVKLAESMAPVSKKSVKINRTIDETFKQITKKNNCWRWKHPNTSYGNYKNHSIITWHLSIFEDK